MPAKSAEAIAGANARKRIKRSIERLEKQRKTLKNRSQGRAFTRQIEELRKQQRATYLPKKGLKTDKQKQNFYEAIKKADKIGERSKALKSATQVRNFAFREQIRWASSENMRALSTLEKEEVKAFYRVTENIWKDLPYNMREKAILKYYDTNSLQEAFEKALSDPKVKEIVEREIKLREIENKREDLRTEEERAFYESETTKGHGETQGSPEWSMEITPFDVDEDWKDKISGEVAK